MSVLISLHKKKKHFIEIQKKKMFSKLLNSKYTKDKIAETQQVIEEHRRKQNNNCALQQMTFLNERCAESYPCKGHGGILIKFDDQSSCQVLESDSVVIAGIMRHFMGYDKMHPHFKEYVEERDCFSDNEEDNDNAATHVEAMILATRAIIDDIDQLKSSHHNGYTVVSIEPINSECLESYPCRGHDGIRVVFENQDLKMVLTKEYDVDDSEEIAKIMKHFMGYKGMHPHFKEYVAGDEKKWDENEYRKMSMDRFLKTHAIMTDINAIQKTGDGYTILSMNPIDPICRKSYLCEGHKGICVNFTNKASNMILTKTYELDDSKEIANIMKHFMGYEKMHSHFKK